MLLLFGPVRFEQLGVFVQALVVGFQQQNLPVNQGLQIVLPSLLPFFVRAQSRQQIEREFAQIFRRDLSLSHYSHHVFPRAPAAGG